MKKTDDYLINWFKYSGILLMAVCITWAVKAQVKQKEAPKTYSISLTLDQWQSVFNGLESVKNAVKTSNMPASQATFISDSLISLYQNEFGRQIQMQLAAEKSKLEVSKDSTNKNKKN